MRDELRGSYNKLREVYDALDILINDPETGSRSLELLRKQEDLVEKMDAINAQLIELTDTELAGYHAKYTEIKAISSTMIEDINNTVDVILKVEKAVAAVDKIIDKVNDIIT